MKTCEHCGKEFEPVRCNQKYCGWECREAVNREYKLEYYGRNYEKLRGKKREYYLKNRERILLKAKEYRREVRADENLREMRKGI